MIAALLSFAMAAERWLPTPFTADQIRAAMPAGTCVTLRIDPPPDQPAVTVLWRVEEATPTHMVGLTTAQLDGAAWSEPEPVRARWTSLQRHARFDVRRTTRARATFDTALGAFDGWRYEVRQSDGTVDVFEFADAMPGPPVRMLDRTAGGSTAITTQVGRGPCPTG